MEKENRDDRVSFSFKNINNPNIGYAAGYSPPTQWDNGEHWLDLTETPKMFPHFYHKEAWQIFYDNATFDDILVAAVGENILDVMHREGLPDFDDHKKWTDKKFLEELSRYPDWLQMIETGALDRFIFMMKTAGIANSKKAEQVCNNLKYYFIPKRPGGSKVYPVNLHGCYYLLKMLSKHISKKCNEFIKAGDNLDRQSFQEYTDESRVTDISVYDLDILLSQPTQYAKKLLEKELYVSMESLKKELKKG
ncbi:MAG: hypothetical protein NT010_11055 [Proteobacteria bacterium]|nr:hypothetical protein [Pseudomonadota bacterium]